MPKPDLCFKRQRGQIGRCATEGDSKVGKPVRAEEVRSLSTQSSHDLTSQLPTAVRTLGCRDGPQPAVEAFGKGMVGPRPGEETQERSGQKEEWPGSGSCPPRPPPPSIHSFVFTSFCKVASVSPSAPEARPVRTETEPQGASNPMIPKVAGTSHNRSKGKFQRGGQLAYGRRPVHRRRPYLL